MNENKLEKSKFNLFKEAFPNFAFMSYVAELRKMMKDCRTVLDIGCGELSPMRFLEFEFLAGLDDDELSLERAKERRTHSVFYKMDISKITERFTCGQFDCCVALDVIEHLKKDDGYKLIYDMERIASKKVIISTPNGFLPQYCKNNNLQTHLSGWEVNEIKKLGFKVIGILGYKFLRGETHNLRFKPKIFWGIVSQLSHYLYTRSNPEMAAAMLCIKLK